MNRGCLNLVLHAHLPYIRHPEHDYFLEENWLFEAIVESYIPLLDVFNRLINDNVDFRVALSISPALVEMFNDSLLRERCMKYMDSLVELSEKEISRTRGDRSFEPLARMYNRRFRKIKDIYEGYNKDLASVLRSLPGSGKIELITSGATHGYLPALYVRPQAVWAQIKVAVESHVKNFGKAPEGIWLPECGYAPGIDIMLKEAGIKFFFTEAHGVLDGTPAPRYGTHRPVACPSGVVVFARDIESSKQVWSSAEGYPGDFTYRDFYRDIGFDLPMNCIRHYVHPDGIRTFTGIKYYRITGKTNNKMPYIRENAIKKAEEHAVDFIIKRKRHIEFLHNAGVFEPVITAPYDMELFGHWWFEGIEWLEFLLRKSSESRDTLRITLPSEHLLKNSDFQTVSPSMSSWGEGGFNDVWLNKSNSWIYRHLHRVSGLMTELANGFPEAGGVLKRALNQAAREVLLSQHSDWAFIIRTGANAEYAVKRITEHIERFNKLYESVRSGSIDDGWLSGIEDRDRIFPWLDYRIYSDQESSLSNG